KKRNISRGLMPGLLVILMVSASSWAKPQQPIQASPDSSDHIYTARDVSVSAYSYSADLYRRADVNSKGNWILKKKWSNLTLVLFTDCHSKIPIIATE